MYPSMTEEDARKHPLWEAFDVIRIEEGLGDMWDDVEYWWRMFLSGAVAGLNAHEQFEKAVSYAQNKESGRYRSDTPNYANIAVDQAQREHHHANALTHNKIIPCGPDGELGMCEACGAAEVEIELYSCEEFKARANT